MGYTIDFKQLKEQVQIPQVLEMLGIKHLTVQGDTLRGTCPLCQHTDQRAFVVTPAKGTWYCWREKVGGDIIRLVARHGRIEDRLAAERIAKHFQGAGKADDKAPAKQEASPPPKSSDFDPLKYLATLDAAHAALKDLDILPETFVTFKAGYSSKGLNRGRLAVAWHDHSGTVRAFIGVALDGSVPRYLMPKGTPLPYWFGIDRLEGEGELRILPTVLDVLRAAENGASNVICPLAPTNGDALTSLKALVDERLLVIEF